MAKKRGMSAAFLKSLRKKHHLGEFKNKRAHSQISHSTTRGKTQMARRKRSRSRSFLKSAAGPMSVLLGGGLYGAVRQKASNALMPITSKIPLGNIADEAVLFGLAYLVRKKVSNKIVKDMALAGMAVEAARIGEAVITGQVGLSASSSSSTSSNTLFA